MTDGTPARIDRAALERIIRRAAELQAAEHDIGEGITVDELVALGREVGIPGRHLQQAVLEERTRVATVAPRGVWNSQVGPAELAARRRVSGEPAEVEQELIGWLEQHELLCIQRRQPGRVTWEPIGGVHAAIRRSTAALGRGKRPFMLSRVETLSATILGVDGGYSHVTLAAVARKARRGYIGRGFATAAAGAGAAAILTALGAVVPVALLPIPAALGLGYGLVRQYAPAAQRVQLGLERALDHLEQGAGDPRPLPPERAGLLGLLADEVRKALRP
jgi:hypothetical protein